MDHDLCKCCSSVVQHVGDHYDPDGITTADEDPEMLLKEFQDAWGEDCNLNVDDVRQYIESRKTESDD